MKILLACGGTGGHLFPAIGLIPAMQQKHELFFVTGMSPLEKELLPETHGNVQRIPSRKLPTHFGQWKSWGSFFMDTTAAVKQSFGILRRFHPDLVIGFGGYASVPVLVAARCRGIPVLLHEQNIIPGKANHLLSRWAKGVAVSFPQALPLWNFHPRVKITGNPGPLRFRNVGYGVWNFPPPLEEDRFTILVMGGSQGAHPINQIVSAALLHWLQVAPEQAKKIQIIHLTGDADFEQVRQTYEKLPMPSYVTPFHEEMHQLYEVSDLAITRAGATSLSELAYFALPAILIPYPHAGAHQLENARIFEQAGAAILLQEKSMAVGILMGAIQSLVTDKAKLRQMREASIRLSIADSDERFLDLVQEVS